MRVSIDDVKQKAADLGFSFAGVIPATPAPTLDAYFRWIEAGMHGRMGYMARPDRQLRRKDLSVIMPGVQSMLIVGLDYRVVGPGKSMLEDPARGRIASYSWGVDYHDVMTPRLEDLAKWLQGEVSTINHRVYVDTGAILERAHAQQAGMGFIGKNTMLIHPQRGSYFFLGEILLDVAFDSYDQPGRMTMCGTCTRCLEACPTDAFPKPYVLDARQCISYLTIENKGPIEHALRPLMGNWIYGCDICQDVCPWQRFTIPTAEMAFHAIDEHHVAPRLVDALQMNDDIFRRIYKNSPIFRIKRGRFVRNACVAAGNWGHTDAVPHLLTLLTDDNPLVRTHAAWALSQIEGDAVRKEIINVYDREQDPDAKLDLARTIELLD